MFLNEPVASSYQHLSPPTPGSSLADSINRFFASVAVDLQPLRPDLCSDLSDDDYGSQYVIEPWQVALALHCLNIHKASGLDLATKPLGLTWSQAGFLRICLFTGRTCLRHNYLTCLLRIVHFRSFGSQLK